MSNVTMFSHNIVMSEGADGTRQWARREGPNLLPFQVAQLEFFYANGYLTKYSIDHASVLSNPKGLYNFTLSNLDHSKIHTYQVPYALCPDALKQGRCGFKSVTVVSTSVMSIEAAAKLIQRDVGALVSGDALLKNMATKERLGLIPKGLQEAAAAAPAPTAPPQVVDHGLDPQLNDIVARHARAAYCEQIDCLLVSSLQDGPPATVAAKLTAALTILREQFAASAI